MMTKSIEELRGEATVLMAEIRPLREKLAKLQHAHNSLATQIEVESRRIAMKKIRKIPAGVSGKKPSTRRQVNMADLTKQFTNLPAAKQAELLAELQAAQ